MTDSPAAALARDEALVEEPAGLVQRDLEGGGGGGSVRNLAAPPAHCSEDEAVIRSLSLPLQPGAAPGSRRDRALRLRERANYMTQPLVELYGGCMAALKVS